MNYFEPKTTWAIIAKSPSAEFHKQGTIVSLSIGTQAKAEKKSHCCVIWTEHKQAMKLVGKDVRKLLANNGKSRAQVQHVCGICMFIKQCHAWREREKLRLRERESQRNFERRHSGTYCIEITGAVPVKLLNTQRILVVFSYSDWDNINTRTLVILKWKIRLNERHRKRQTQMISAKDLLFFFLLWWITEKKYFQLARLFGNDCK